jgi:hypothetical protein
VPCETLGEKNSYLLKRSLFLGSQVFDRNWNAFEDSFNDDVPLDNTLKSADDQARLSDFE